MTNTPPKRTVTVATPRFLDALTFATTLHGSDHRKGSNIPYVAHLLGVCSNVLYDGGTEDEAIAALLHDTLEDHPKDVSRDEIERRFGTRVLELVEECTDTPADYAGGEKPPWKERKLAYIEHLRSAGTPGRRVALADKLDNARSLLRDLQEHGEDVWTRFNAGRNDQLWFLREIADAARIDTPLWRDFAAVVDEIHRVAGAEE